MARVLFALVLLLGCTARIPEGRLECDRDEDCPPGWTCVPPQLRCYSAPDAH